MARYLIQDTTLLEIVSAIQQRTGQEESLTPAQMVSKIQNADSEFAFYATVSVTYPEGSTCTCTNAATGAAFADDGTTGQVLFIIPYAGDWTITSTANDGSGDAASKTVSINTEGQEEVVTLAYSLLLYDAGDECTSVTGGWTLYAWGVSTAEKQSDCIYLFNNDGQEASATSEKNIDMSDYNTLNVKLKSGWKTNSGYFEFSAGGASKTTSSVGAKTYTLDISTVSSGKITFRPYGLWSDDANQLSECGVYISRVWLS